LDEDVDTKKKKIHPRTTNAIEGDGGGKKKLFRKLEVVES